MGSDPSTQRRITMTEQSILINAIVDAIAEAVVLKTKMQKSDRVAIDENFSYVLDQIRELEKRIEAIESNAESDSRRLASISDELRVMDDNISDKITEEVRDLLSSATVSIDV
jgi:hypothetical protein